MFEVDFVHVQVLGVVLVVVLLFGGLFVRVNERSLGWISSE